MKQDTFAKLIFTVNDGESVVNFKTEFSKEALEDEFTFDSHYNDMFNDAKEEGENVTAIVEGGELEEPVMYDAKEINHTLFKNLVLNGLK